MSQSDDIRAAVLAILESAGVTFSAVYVRETKRDDWQCDQWLCVFTRAQAIVSNFAPRAGGASHVKEEFDYFTGLGHRKPDESHLAKMSAASLAKVSKRMLAWQNHYKRFPDKPQAPCAADVLHSLVLDMDAIGQSFESWASEYGYDTDSRKAEGIYRACQQSADKMARVFTRAQIDALRDALQDY